MTTNRTTVTHADGTVSTRGSKTRAYTHAVEITPATAERAAADMTLRAAKAAAKAAALRAAADAGRVTVKYRGFAGNGYNSHSATLTGSDVYTWSNAEGITHDIVADVIIPAIDYLAASARAQADLNAAEAARLNAEAAATLAAGVPVGAYGILRWSSSAVNAAKGAREFEDFYAARGHTVRVVPVD